MRKWIGLFLLFIGISGISALSAAQARDPRVLLFSHSTGYRHASIEPGAAAIQALGTREKLTMVAERRSGCLQHGRPEEFRRDHLPQQQHRPEEAGVRVVPGTAARGAAGVRPSRRRRGRHPRGVGLALSLALVPADDRRPFRQASPGNPGGHSYRHRQEAPREQGRRADHAPRRRMVLFRRLRSAFDACW